MGKHTGFMEVDRHDISYKPVSDRLTHFDEFTIALSDQNLQDQGSRCMDCGIPFCHQGCPVNNIIPDWNDLVYQGDWQDALAVLHSTNNFPEFTGRICPAPCEAACTLNLDDAPVTIKHIEYSIIEKGWQEGWIEPQIPEHHTDKKVAIVGSGPAGMACAQQLARAGHQVALYEKQNRIGGLLRYGIPDFKLNKSVIDRRIAQMRTEGVEFHVNTEIGKTIAGKTLLNDFDAVILTGGSEKPRDLDSTTAGRELEGIYFAMDFLRCNSQRVQGDKIPEQEIISAQGKHVVVIGGGDTGSDCIGTSARQGAASITQIEIMPKPPEKEDKLLTWPEWPNKIRTSSSQEEGCERQWSVLTKAFIDDGQGNVKALQCIKVEWQQDQNGQWQMSEIAGSEFELKADLVTLAMGFVHPIHEGLLNELAVDLDPRGNVQSNTEGDDAYKTSLNKVFSAGDMRRGQSLVVWAIREGRQCARAVDAFLMGKSELPR